ncbi:MAG: helix-turn-helix domain-containing protein [Terriglobales bacterium]
MRKLRESLHLSIRDVEAASQRIAAKYENQDFYISLSRLSDIESKGVLPNMYKLYTLSVIYRCDIRELLSWFGIDLGQTAADMALAAVPVSHRCTALESLPTVRVPIRLDPAFNTRSTVNLGRMIMKWGTVPFAYLSQFCDASYTYGYIGTEDYTMYPLLLPGSFVQIDEARNKVVERMWRSEYERPIYFVETRDGMTCSWCERNGELLILKPHPLSPVRTRTLRFEKEAEIIGQVIAVAMHLGEWADVSALPAETKSRASN